MAKKNPCQGKHREFGNFAKTQGIWFAQVVNSLILKVKDTAIFATKISIFSPRSWIGLPSQFHVIVTNDVNWYRENLRLDRENTGNLKIQFEWVPCRLVGVLQNGPKPQKSILSHTYK